MIVFFDEIHQLAAPAVTDLAQAIKPALARGEIACIGATTGEEYQANIEPDAALARRFTTISIEPMDARTVRDVLAAVRDSLGKARGVTMGDDVLDEAIALADQFLPNRSFPDKGVDIIEQSIAHALAHRRQDRRSADRCATRSSRSSACRSTRRARLAALDHGADRARPARPRPIATRCSARLGVSLRGLDTNYERPDAICAAVGRRRTRRRRRWPMRCRATCSAAPAR